MTTYDEWKHENWDRAHREHDLSALTGTDLSEHLAVLSVGEFVRPNATVLCVGIGLGAWVTELSEQVAGIWGLDISPVAGVRMPRGSRFVTDSKMLPSNSFDLALSLWVAPHMNNLDLEEQLREVIRSLNPSGIFAIHYKEPLDDGAVLDNREGAEDEWERAEAAMMLRRRRHFEDMVRQAGGHVARIALESRSQFYKTVEVSAHVGKGAKS